MAYIEAKGFRFPRKKRNWISILLAIITLSSVLLSAYYAQNSLELQKRNQELQNSIYNFDPLIFANASLISKLKTLYYDHTKSDGEAIFFGSVSIDLKIITPNDGVLTLKIKSFNFTYLNDSSNPTSRYLSANTSGVYETGKQVHQYFIFKEILNSINDEIPVHVQVFLKPNLVGVNDIRGMGFRLGDVVFEANLLEIRTNKTIIQEFSQPIWIDLVDIS